MFNKHNKHIFPAPTAILKILVDKIVALLHTYTNEIHHNKDMNLSEKTLNQFSVGGLSLVRPGSFFESIHVSFQNSSKLHVKLVHVLGQNYSADLLFGRLCSD